MQSHGPKRVYTPQSLEFWFEKLAGEWEHFFTSEQLELGHRIYRDGEVRELELTATDAIIHRRIEKKDEYAVIEWSKETLSVRSSLPELDVARGLAVAGLHEIEELVADELPVLPTSNEDELPAAKDSGSPWAQRRGRGVSSMVKALPRTGGAATAESRLPSRTLVLAFRTTMDGLVFQAYWQDRDKNRVPALGPMVHADGNGHVTSGERAKLIGLATYARKAHFAYSQLDGLYTLSSVVEIPNFLRRVMPAWKRLFSIELDPEASNLVKGNRKIVVEAIAEAHPAAKKAGGGRNGAGISLNLRWIFKAGEQMLTDAEVNALLSKGKSPVILPSLGIVELPTEQLDSLNEWRNNVDETHAPGELSPYLLFSLYNDTRFKLNLSPELEAWRQSVLESRPVEATLPGHLRPYQRRGVEWMVHLCESGCHGLLADEMGLGKTLQVLALLASRPLANQPSLIVCPASVVPVWQEEIQRFHPHLRVEVLKMGNDFQANTEPVVWLASYTQLRKHRGLLDSTQFGYAVLDEGQFIKNPDAKVTQSCFAVRSDHRIVLTGTPLENRQLDLWSIFRFLLPGLLGSRSSFEAALNTSRPEMLDQLRAQLAPFILRRTKKEVARDLPPKVEMDLHCPLTEVQRSEYARVCAEGLDRLGDDVGAAMKEKSFGFLALLTRLRQTCCDPDMLPWRRSPLSDSGKIMLLIDKLAEIIGSGHKVVIFSQFVMLLDRVRTALAESYPDLPRYELTGMTIDRQKPVADFQQQEGAAAMLVSLKAAGTGITLHAADYVFLLDPWWNPAVEAQAIDRVHRIGQTNTVFVYRMVTSGTIEERIEDLKASKRELFDRLVGGLGGDFDLSQHFSSLRDLVQLTTAAADSSEANESVE